MSYFLSVSTQCQDYNGKVGKNRLVEQMERNMTWTFTAFTAPTETTLWKKKYVYDHLYLTSKDVKTSQYFLMSSNTHSWLSMACDETVLILGNNKEAQRTSINQIWLMQMGIYLLLSSRIFNYQGLTILKLRPKQSLMTLLTKTNSAKMQNVDEAQNLNTWHTIKDIMHKNQGLYDSWGRKTLG